MLFRSLIKANQWGSGPNGVNKRTHDRIHTSIISTQISIGSPRETHALIKRFNHRIANWLQTRLTKSKREIGFKPATKIGNHARTTLVLLSGKPSGSTFCQVLSTTLKQQLLKYSAMNERSDNMAGPSLTLIIMEDI